jgi:DNA repair protein RecO (recombination protein O)
MQEEVRAIVIAVIPYTDKSRVVRLYSREKGALSCMAGRAGTGRAGVRTSLLQPMSVVNVVLSAKSKGMPYIKEISPVVPLYSLFTDPVKASVGMFLTDVLNHTLIESHPDRNMFEFIEQSFLHFEMAESCPVDFHLSFLWKLTAFIGIGPRNDFDHREYPYFDTVNGCFAATREEVSIPVSPELSSWISYFIKQEVPVTVSAKMSREVRRDLLFHTVSYFNWHLGWKDGLRSLGILQEVFEG